MFPDSKVASQLGLGKAKCAYTLLYGIAPYITDVLNDALQEAPVYSLSFGESYNRVLKKVANGPFDSLLGWDFWHGQHTVLWQYMSLQSCSHWCFENFNSIAKNLHETNFLQVISDCPNVNKFFLNLLAETRKEKQRSRLVDLRTCRLHTLQYGFQHGKKASGWEFKSLLNAMYKIFDESPARRADYEKITTAIESDYALQFCSHR